MQEFFEDFFGNGLDLNVWQMSARASAVFVVALLLIRISGRRSFGLHSPFDSCTTVLLGAILSRGVSGASPFLSTIAAATALVILHRLTALASVRWSWFEKIVSGTELLLVSEGKRDHRALSKALVTEKDLEEALRRKKGDEELKDVFKVILERNGEITVVTRNPKD